MKKIVIVTVAFLCLISCSSLSEKEKKNYKSVYDYSDVNYVIKKPYVKGKLSFYKDESYSRKDKDSIFYRVYNESNTENILASIIGIPPFLKIDFLNKKVMIDSVKIDHKNRDYKEAYYPKAKELYYKEELIEYLNEPMNPEDREVYRSINRDLSEKDINKIVEGGFKKDLVYAKIKMPNETLKIKYVKGRYSAFFGTDELYEKGVLLFYTGDFYNVKSMEKYSGLYVIRPKEVSDTVN